MQRIMINSGKEYDYISEKIAQLRTFIKQSGKQGKLDINKTSENFVMNLLNLAYGYDLTNLNEKKKQYPGIDLGDTESLIAFQVTSDKGSDKVDDMLEKVIKFEHYKVFNKFYVFNIVDKQTSYSIKTDTKGLFDFFPDKHILDFDDFLSKISNVAVVKLQAIKDFIISEFEDVKRAIEDPTFEKNNNGFLINIDKSLSESKMDIYRHWYFRIELDGIRVSAPKMFQHLEKSLDTTRKVHYFPIFNSFYRSYSDGKEVKYTMALKQDNVQGDFKESILVISANTVQFEFAHYVSASTFGTNLYYELGSFLTLTITLNSLLQGDGKLDIKSMLSCNDRLYFMPQSSLASINKNLTSYILNPSPLEVNKILDSTENSELISFIEEILLGFSGVDDGFYGFEPYMTLDLIDQRAAIENFKIGILGITS